MQHLVEEKLEFQVFRLQVFFAQANKLKTWETNSTTYHSRLEMTRGPHAYRVFASPGGRTRNSTGDSDPHEEGLESSLETICGKTAPLIITLGVQRQPVGFSKFSVFGITWKGFLPTEFFMMCATQFQRRRLVSQFKRSITCMIFGLK